MLADTSRGGNPLFLVRPNLATLLDLQSPYYWTLDAQQSSFFQELKLEASVVAPPPRMH